MSKINKRRRYTTVRHKYPQRRNLRSRSPLKSGWIRLGSGSLRDDLTVSKRELNKGLNWAQLVGKNVKTEVKIYDKSKVLLTVDINFKVKEHNLEKVYPKIYTSLASLGSSEVKINKESSSINIGVHINVQKKLADRIYPDILIMLIGYMDIKSYLNFISGNDLDDMSLLNGPYIKYLKTYSPGEYEHIVENRDVVLQTHRNLDPKSSSLIYEIHRILNPEYYEDEY